MCKILTVLLFIIIALTACIETTSSYIDTEFGLVRYSRHHCTFGVLTNNDYVNIFKVDGTPIICTPGIVKLTDPQYEAWSK